MDATEILIRLLAGVVLILANAFFVATEFALTRARQFPAEAFQNSPGLRRAWQMTETLELHLTGCQLGISSTSILLGVVAEPGLTWLLEPVVGAMGATHAHAISVVIAIVGLNLIHKIYGEQAPTYLGVERPLQVADRLAPALYVWSKVMKPFILFGDRAAKAVLRLFGVEIRRSWTEEDATAAEDEAAQGDNGGPVGYGEAREQLARLLARAPLDEERREEVLRALTIERLPVRDIMVPRDRIRFVDAQGETREQLRRIGRSGVTRILVRDLDGAFTGTLYLPAVMAELDGLLEGRVRLTDLTTELVRIDADAVVSEAIDLLQEHGHEIALIEDHGEALGLITITDALEAIVGNLADPTDPDR